MFTEGIRKFVEPGLEMRNDAPRPGSKGIMNLSNDRTSTLKIFVRPARKKNAVLLCCDGHEVEPRHAKQRTSEAFRFDVLSIRFLTKRVSACFLYALKTLVS